MLKGLVPELVRSSWDIGRGFPVITLSQPNYSYGCSVVEVVVVAGL